MKPPSRHRIIPSRLLPFKGTVPTRKFCNGWGKHEQQNLIKGLKLQQKFNSELDLLELRKRVPKRTLLEVQNVIKSLKSRAVRRVYQQIRKQRWEGKKNKAPIEIWAELAQKMAGVHEETISSAFSQMLAIAATEPCSQQHSHPPRFFSTSIPIASNLHTETKSRAGSKSRLSSSPSHGDVTLQSQRKDESLTCQNTVPSASISCTEKGSDCTQRITVMGQASEKPSTSSITKSNSCQPTTTTMSPVEASSSNQMNKQHESGQSEQDHQSRSMRVECKVDFERIYRFMSNINKKGCSLALPAMECAVLLDLLMSLPEELPLLDCKELQNHLLQVHTRLASPPVNTSSIPSTDQRSAAAELVTSSVKKPLAVDHAKATDTSLQIQDVQTVGAVAELPLADGNSSTKLSAINPPKDWAEVGLCPLNPFMVPVGLLKRQQS